MGELRFELRAVETTNSADINDPQDFLYWSEAYSVASDSGTHIYGKSSAQVHIEPFN
jgi:hypothetical protein